MHVQSPCQKRSSEQIAVHVRFPAETSPMLVVAVHTEEEFDWSTFDREATTVKHARALPRLQMVFDDVGAAPTYFVGYPFATQEESAAILRPLVADRRSHIGAHLHPWVCPPLLEEITTHNSYHGNLSAELEKAKLASLTEAITTGLGIRPRAFLAGRYGYGPNTGPALRALGYRVDFSPSPAYDYARDGGPDYSEWVCDPFWEGDHQALLRIPHTSAYVGFLCRGGRRPFAPERVAALAKLRLPGILARLRAMRRIRLSPEGHALSDMIALTRHLYRHGTRLFVLSLHSPSMAPGFTPYTRTAAEVDHLLAAVAGYLDFFIATLGGRVVGPDEARAAAEQLRPAPPRVA